MEPRRKFALDVCLNLGLGERSFDSVFIQMWRNIRDDGGFRLTDQGAEWLTELGIKSYVIPLPKETVDDDIRSGSILLGLDRKLKAPYHLRGKRLSIFDDNISTQLLLFGGDLKLFFEANS
jgi:hypothetical protein